MKIDQTPIDNLLVTVTTYVTDSRGVFSRLYCQKELQEIIGERQVVQINKSCTHSVGAVRGLHYQYPPHAEMKLIRCLKGKVWDVAVDLRAQSSTFLQWHAVELSPKNARMFVIPEGFAHGFQVLEPDSELLYLHTEFYTREVEDGIAFDEPRINIPWPLPAIDLSVRDMSHLRMAPDYSGIKI